MQLPGAANKRFLTTAGNFSNRVIVDLVRKNFPEFNEAMPSASVKGGNYPAEGIFQIDNARSREVLGIEYEMLEETVVATVVSFKAAGA